MLNSSFDYPKIGLLAKKIRIHALRMTSNGGSSHIGSILSCADILATLYGGVLKFDPTNPKLIDRDRFILSKGHAGAGVYAALAEAGFFAVSKLSEHYQNGSIFSGHVSHKGVPGVELSTGSLGHGLPVAVGMAMHGKINEKKHRIFVLMSDGECDEGTTWESALLAAHHRLSNLVVIVDFNGLQSIKTTNETLNLHPFVEKWSSFCWDVVEVDGHNPRELAEAISTGESADRPLCVVARTVKGRGVSFMENNVLWHYRTARGAEFDSALLELEG